MRFEYCLDSHGEPQYIRAIQGHSGMPRIDPKFFTLLEIPYEWKVHIYHTVSSKNWRSFVEGGLIAGGTSDRTRGQACFVSVMDLLEEPLSDFIEYQQISQDVKNIVKEQCNLDAQEMLMITNTVQCKSCYNYATPGYTSCKCGFILPGASDEIKKQVPKDVMNFFSMLTTSAFVLKAGTSREKTVGRSEGSQLYHLTRVSITKVL